MPNIVCEHQQYLKLSPNTSMLLPKRHGRNCSKCERVFVKSPPERRKALSGEFPLFPTNEFCSHLLREKITSASTRPRRRWKPFQEHLWVSKPERVRSSFRSRNRCPCPSFAR